MRKKNQFDYFVKIVWKQFGFRRLCAASIITIALINFASPCGLCEQAVEKPRMVWTRERCEIEAPAFSADGREIVITIKAHDPDGHEAEALSQAELKAISDRKLKNPRWADPQICILRLADKSVKVVDYGWSGTFSKDGKSVFYDHQVKPISGLRRLAKPLSGNDIRVYDRQSGKSSIVVPSPSEGYLANPLVSPDGLRLAYTINDAVNGDWGGTVGAGIVNLKSGSHSTIFAPAKAFDLYKLVGPVFWAGNLLIAQIDTPLDFGSYVADHYTTAILNERGKCLYRVKTRDINIDDFTCGNTADEKIKVCQKDVCTILDPLTGLRIRRKADLSPGAVASPNGQFFAYNRKGKLVLKNLKTGSLRSIICRGELKAIVWSNDSSEIAFVSDIGTTPDSLSPFVRSELWRLKI